MAPTCPPPHTACQRHSPLVSPPPALPAVAGAGGHCGMKRVWPTRIMLGFLMSLYSRMVLVFTP